MNVYVQELRSDHQRLSRLLQFARDSLPAVQGECHPGDIRPLRQCIEYIRDYSVGIHQQREDILFQQLVERDESARIYVDVLSAEHRLMTHNAAELHQTVALVEKGRNSHRSQLDRAMREVLSQGLAARTLTLKLRYVDGGYVERSRTLKVATRHEANLIPLAERMLKDMFTRRVAVHLVGVALSGLVPVDGFQRALFDGDREESLERLGDAIQKVRERHGFGAIIQGAAMELIDLLPRDRDGFRLRVPSLTR